MAESLMVTITTEPKDGSMRTTACGRMILRSSCQRLMPSARPAHWRRVAACRLPVTESHTAVNSGCRPTMRAAVPADMPLLTAAHTPPR